MFREKIEKLMQRYPDGTIKTTAEVAKIVGCSKTTAYKHLTNMLNEGKIDAKYHRYSRIAGLMRWIARNRH